MATDITYLNQVCQNGTLQHFHAEVAGALLLCLEPCDCEKPSLVPLLFGRSPQAISLALEAPDAEDPRGGPSEHPHLTVHLNPDDTYGHDHCVLVDACAVCFTDLWPSLLAAGYGRIGQHLPGHGGQVETVEFTLARAEESAAAVATALSRYVTDPA